MSDPGRILWYGFDMTDRQKSFVKDLCAVMTSWQWTIDLEFESDGFMSMNPMGLMSAVMDVDDHKSSQVVVIFLGFHETTPFGQYLQALQNILMFLQELGLTRIFVAEVTDPVKHQDKIWSVQPDHNLNALNKLIKKQFAVIPFNVQSIADFSNHALLRLCGINLNYTLRSLCDN
jgi:hypothetical protein